MKITNLSELTAAVDRLQGLLKDPHPGLSAWVCMYGELMQAISDFWNQRG